MKMSCYKSTKFEKKISWKCLHWARGSYIGKFALFMVYCIVSIKRPGLKFFQKSLLKVPYNWKNEGLNILSNRIVDKLDNKVMRVIVFGNLQNGLEFWISPNLLKVSFAQTLAISSLYPLIFWSFKNVSPRVPLLLFDKFLLEISLICLSSAIFMD